MKRRQLYFSVLITWVAHVIFKNYRYVDVSNKWAGGGFLSTSEDVARYTFFFYSLILLFMFIINMHKVWISHDKRRIIKERDNQIIIHSSKDCIRNWGSLRPRLGAQEIASRHSFFFSLLSFSFFLFISLSFLSFIIFRFILLSYIQLLEGNLTRPSEYVVFHTGGAVGASSISSSFLLLLLSYVIWWF